MRNLTPTTLYTQERSLDERVSSLERRFDPDLPCCFAPTAKCTMSSTLTVESGAYWNLAQLEGTDPSSFGAGEMIQVWNDPADGTEVFRVKVELPDVTGSLQVFNGTYVMAYKSICTIDGPIDVADWTIQTYLGSGVGGGPLSQHVSFLEEESASDLQPKIQLDGIFVYEFPLFDPDTTGAPDGAFPGPVLLGEHISNPAETFDVLEWEYTLSRVGELDVDSELIFTP